MKAVFFGTSDISREILEHLLSSGIEIPLVITTPDRKVGRGGILTPNQVAAYAADRGIEVLKGEKPAEFTANIRAAEPDFIVVADYGKIIPIDILEIPKYGPINVHYSLLPKYRGASPVKYAILNGDSETGVTIMLMNERLDEGAILRQQKVTIADEDDHSSLMRKLNDIGKVLLVSTLTDFANGKIKAVAQDETQASYVKKVTKEDGRIDWHRSSVEIERMVRAFKNWPGAWTKFATKSVKIIDAKSLNNNVVQGEPGTVENVFGELHVRTGKGDLHILKIQLEGRAPVSGRDFLNSLRGVPARFD